MGYFCWDLHNLNDTTGMRMVPSNLTPKLGACPSNTVFRWTGYPFLWHYVHMNKTFRPWNVDDVWLLPPSVQELVPEGHPAHFVRDLARHELDLSPVFASYTEERGYPPYHPAMMAALLLYAYSRGVHSSRRIARCRGERVDFMAVTATSVRTTARSAISAGGTLRRSAVCSPRSWPCAARRVWPVLAMCRWTAPRSRRTPPSTGR